MRGLLFTLAVLALFVTACGGKEKPPLTPDTDNGLLDAGVDPGAPAAPIPGK
ncbi:MAG: hypothetical protein U0235_09410 [Polyangiaceae bacterium]